MPEETALVRIRTKIATTSKGLPSYDLTVEQVIPVDHPAQAQHIIRLAIDMLLHEQDIGISKLLERYPTDVPIRDPLLRPKPEAGADDEPEPLPF